MTANEQRAQWIAAERERLITAARESDPAAYDGFMESRIAAGVKVNQSLRERFGIRGHNYNPQKGYAE